MNKIWKETYINLGEVPERSKTKFQFLIKEDLDKNAPKIKYIKPTCGCTSLKTSKEGVAGVFSSGTIPRHLHSSTQKVTKRLEVFYEDGTTELLSFTATLVKK